MRFFLCIFNIDTKTSDNNYPPEVFIVKFYSLNSFFEECRLKLFHKLCNKPKYIMFNKKDAGFSSLIGHCGTIYSVHIFTSLLPKPRENNVPNPCHF